MTAQEQAALADSELWGALAIVVSVAVLWVLLALRRRHRERLALARLRQPLERGPRTLTLPPPMLYDQEAPDA